MPVPSVSFVVAVGLSHLRRLVLSENETAALDHVKAIFVSIILFCGSLTQTFACSTCFGNYGDVGESAPANVQHLAVAIWVLMFIVMSVLGGISGIQFSSVAARSHADRAVRPVDRRRFVAV